MEPIETLIPDNEGNHLVVVLYFYDDRDKAQTFRIPSEFIDLEIADININKLDMSRNLANRAFYKLCDWLLEQFLLNHNAVFSFICSTDPLESRKKGCPPERRRWDLFECLLSRSMPRLIEYGIRSNEIIVGPEGYQTYARVFYRDTHAPIIHIVESHLRDKYSD